LCDKEGKSPFFAASGAGECYIVKCLLNSGADINLCDKHLTTSHAPPSDAINNGDCPPLSHKLISAPELSKHLTTSQYPIIDAINNGDWCRYQFV
jgi:hypothetical protein